VPLRFCHVSRERERERERGTERRVGPNNISERRVGANKCLLAAAGCA